MAKWTTSDPLLAGIRAHVRSNKRISVDAVYSAARSKEERNQVLGVLKQFKHAHPDRWEDIDMLGSLLKRIRNRGIVV